MSNSSENSDCDNKNDIFEKLKLKKHSKNSQVCFDDLKQEKFINNKFGRGTTLFKRIQTIFTRPKKIEKNVVFKSKLERMDSYRRNLWKKNFFVILFYIKIFLEKLKKNSSKFKLMKLKKFHYDLINDYSHISGDLSIFNYNEKLNDEWNKIIINPQKNKLSYKFQKAYFCTIFFLNLK